ncbi:MAG: hypothetical protein KDJ47_17635 [Hyphomicrobiaceae bacterium]|nr:hypothetical protein [Hyphomicrobiaceae bacterium]
MRFVSLLVRLQEWIERNPRLALRLLFLIAASAILLRTYSVASPKAVPESDDARLAIRILDKAGLHAINPAQLPLSKKPSVMPGFAVVLAGIASVDSATRDTLSCAMGRGPCHNIDLRWLYLLQGGLAVATLWLFFKAAHVMSGSRDVAVLAALLLLLSAPFGGAAGYARPFIYPVFLLAGYAALAAASVRRQSLPLYASSGAVLALTAMFHAWMLLALPLAASVTLLAPAPRQPFITRAMRFASFLAGGIAVLVAAYALLVGTGLYDIEWALRSITYDLSLRAGYDAITPMLAAFGTLVEFPLVGGLAETLAPQSWTHPFGPYLPGTFLMGGHTDVFGAALRASSSGAEELLYVARRVGSEVDGYLLATPVTLLRGLIAKADVIAIIGLFNWRRMFAHHAAVNDSYVLWLVAAPFLTLLVAGTLLTTNMFFTPVALAYVHVYAIASVSGRL